MTRRGKGLVVAVVAAFLAGRAYGVPQLHVGALTGILLLVGAAALVWTSVTRLVVDRTVAPGTVWAGTTATVTLVVRNTALLPSPPAVLVDALPASFGQRQRCELPPLTRGARTAVTYEVVAVHRGTVTIGPATLRIGDPFGLFTRTVALEGTSTLTVLPAVHRVPPGLPLGGATSQGASGNAAMTSEGEDLADVREYVHGDDLRSIHWPSSAHRGSLMVRKAESPRAPRAIVLLDTRAGRHVGTGATASIEAAVTAAASAAYHLALRGRSLVLLDRPITRPPTPLGWEQLLTELADVQPSSHDLGTLLHQLGQGAAGDGTLVAVLTTPSAGELRQLVRAGRGFATRVALLVDVASHRRVDDPATDAAVAALRDAGFRAVALRAGERVDLRWHELLARPRTASAVGR